MTTEPTPDRPKFNPRTFRGLGSSSTRSKPAHDRYRRALRKAEAHPPPTAPRTSTPKRMATPPLAEMEAAIRSWVAATACTCPRLAIGMEVTEVRDGPGAARNTESTSAWWNSPNSY
ncbi:hypothetical protein [Kitasatospora cineracea]|uniref:Uncharacterized protein n=1 Tax=Kitasatospora cineracea TaxID=88074 RepID=A0A3N4R1K8_9ACTN|nr:hypothetical protein [Kitasatospora cineracea]RPE27208.1 hypothetical protein EDD38_7352 [Kitasatospora cineracea]